MFVRTCSIAIPSQVQADARITSTSTKRKRRRMAPRPSKWDASRAGAHIAVDGTLARYVGAGASDRDAASVRSDVPTSRREPMYYFEVRVRSTGREGFIGVGLSASGVRADRLPGWEPGSVGYHGDDGRVFVGGARGNAYGPTYAAGDVVGCLLDRSKKTVEFFKNGVALGVAATGLGDEDMWPTVGLRTPGEEVDAVFAPPYVADEARMVAEAKRYARETARADLQNGMHAKDIALDVVTAHLRHHGYVRAARKVVQTRERANSMDKVGSEQARTSKAQCKEDEEVVSMDVSTSPEQAALELVNMEAEDQARVAAVVAAAAKEEKLNRAVEHARHGEVDNAMALVAEVRGTEADPPPARLRLLAACQALVEAVREKDTPTALAIARGDLAKAAKDGGDARVEDAETMREVVALLAYDDPATSPVGHCLAQNQRERFADALRAVGWSVLHGGSEAEETCTEESPLESIFKQIAVVLQELQEGGCATAALLDVHDYIPTS